MRTAMRREIAEQSEAIARTLSALRPLKSRIAELGRSHKHVLLVGRGSSDNAAVYGRYLLEVHAGRMASLAAPSVATHYHSKLDLSDCLVVCLSQSGQTQEIVETQRWASACGGATIAISNVRDSPLVRDADLALVTQAGPELAIPATKTFTTQLAAVAVLASALAPDPLMLDAELDRVPEEIDRLVARRSGVDQAVDLLLAQHAVIVTGRGLAYATALETALKLEETCLRPVRGLSYADLKHGPIAVVDPLVVSIVMAAQDGPTLAGLTELLGDLGARGGSTVAVGGDQRFAAAADVHVAGPNLSEKVSALGLVVAGQLLAEGLSTALGLDPDAPRGLRKVTQTDGQTGRG